MVPVVVLALALAGCGEDGAVDEDGDITPPGVTSVTAIDASDYVNVSFIQTLPLAAATTYTVTLDGVADEAGNPMPLTSWSFTTAGATPCL